MIEGVEKLKSKMLLQAGSESEKILSVAKKEANEIKAENKMKVDSYLDSQNAKISGEAQLLADRELASAYMASRKEFMDEREKILDSIIEQAVDKLNSAKDYPAFLERNLKEYGKLMGASFEIQCNKKDITVLKKIAEKLKFKAKVIEGSLRAGLILIGKDSRINLSIESLLEEKSKDIRKEIVSVIGA